MPSRRILVASYYYPPDESIGARRWAAMADYLRELGHEVTVLTTTAWGSSPTDGQEVVRASDLAKSARLRLLLKRPALPEPGQAPPIQKVAPRLLTDGLVPDGYLATWAPYAALELRRLVQDRRIECIVTSGPPHSTHLIALAAGAARPAWIADFRDGWRFEPARPEWPLRAQRLIDTWLERRVVRSAEMVVGVTHPIVEDVRTRLGATAELVPNAWDPRSLIDPSIAPISLDAESVNVVHTGALSAVGGRDPSLLFEAMWQLHRSEDRVAQRIKLVLAGRLSQADVLLLERAPPNVLHVGHLPPGRTFALQRRSDALLLITAQGRRSEATGKLFEYLSAGRPIIALARDNEAARIVAGSRTGIVVAPERPDLIADALIAAADGRLSRSYHPKGVGRYVYPSPAAEFSARIEEAVGLARVRRPSLST